MNQTITELLEELNDTETPKIYVACLSSYNGGRLHGAWIDCDQDSDEIMTEIKAMLSKSPMNEIEEGEECEEWAIHDYQGFKGLTISEHEGIDRVAQLAASIEEHGEAFAAYVECLGTLKLMSLKNGIGVATRVNKPSQRNIIRS
jgi:antirestriction protein